MEIVDKRKPLKARVLLTKECFRSCSYCCNNYPETMKSLVAVDRVTDLLKYDEICLTGGEPLQDYRRTLQVASILKGYGKKVFLYTTMWSSKFDPILALLDGIHYTVHNPCHWADSKMLFDFQESLKLCSVSTKFAKGSYRLYIDPDVKRNLTINPSLFTRIESKPWMKDGECPVPEDALIYFPSDTERGELTI